MIERDQEGEKKRPGGTFFRGGTLSRGSPARRSLAKPTFLKEPASASRSVFRFFSRRGFCLAAGGAGLRPAGNPIKGFPAVRQPTGLSDLPFLIFSVSFGVFRPLRRARRGAAPPPCQPFEKRLDRKLSLHTLRKLSPNSVQTPGSAGAGRR